ncbi:LOW QUALITY PROTEIN: hypothetical protein PanWU01x14_014500, partial [Parasponia andersonii]
DVYFECFRYRKQRRNTLLPTIQRRKKEKSIRLQVGNASWPMMAIVSLQRKLGREELGKLLARCREVTAWKTGMRVRW